MQFVPRGTGGLGCSQAGEDYIRTLAGLEKVNLKARRLAQGFWWEMTGSGVGQEWGDEGRTVLTGVHEAERSGRGTWLRGWGGGWALVGLSLRRRRSRCGGDTFRRVTLAHGEP